MAKRSGSRKREFVMSLADGQGRGVTVAGGQKLQRDSCAVATLFPLHVAVLVRNQGGCRE